VLCTGVTSCMYVWRLVIAGLDATAYNWLLSMAATLMLSCMDYFAAGWRNPILDV